MQNPQLFPITEDINIQLVSPVYFLATKFEAFKGRGNKDLLSSRDIEDILNLIDGRDELGAEVAQALDDAKAYLVFEFSSFLALPDALYAVQSAAKGDIAREKIIFERIEYIALLGRTNMEVPSQFRPSTARLGAVMKEGEELLVNTQADDLGGFSELFGYLKRTLLGSLNSLKKELRNLPFWLAFETIWEITKTVKIYSITKITIIAAGTSAKRKYISKRYVDILAEGTEITV